MLVSYYISCCMLICIFSVHFSFLSHIMNFIDYRISALLEQLALFWHVSYLVFVMKAFLMCCKVLICFEIWNRTHRWFFVLSKLELHWNETNYITLFYFYNFSGRTGKIRVQSLKIGLMSLSKGLLEEKYRCKNVFYKMHFLYIKSHIVIMQIVGKFAVLHFLCLQQDCFFMSK